MSGNVIKNFTMPLVFLGIVLFAIIFGDFIPNTMKSVCYSISLCIKNSLIFFLPLIIFSLVFNAVGKLGTKAIKFVVIIIPLVCCSNFINTIISYIVGMCACKISINTLSLVVTKTSTLLPVFSIELPQIISNDIALVLGILCGIVVGLIKNKRINKWLVQITDIFNTMQNYFFKILIPIMPLFILGTTLKLQHDNMLTIICKNYLSVLFVFVISAYGLVLLQYLILSSFEIKKFVQYIKNIFPAVITGFGSMSSAAALPLSIRGTEANSLRKENASIIILATVNIHLIGDCLFIPMIATVIMISFDISFPDFYQYCVFALHFVLAKFAVAAVPGGGILVMLPILQNYLNFTTDMLGLITAIYVLFDPVITACNVAGNGAMGIVFDRIISYIHHK